MRGVLIVGLVLVLLSAVAMPLSAVLIPFLSFRQYAHLLPVVFSHSHIQNSLVSIRDAGFASLCLSPLVSQLPAFCAWPANPSSNIYAALVDLALVQGNMGEQLAQHDLTDSFNSALSVQRASDMALAFDDLVLLFQDGNLELHGTAHVRLLAEVNQASRSLWAALYRITLHVELGLGRLAYIDKTVLAGMKRLVRLDGRRQIVAVSPLLLSHLVNISSSATLDSINHVRAEIATAEATFSALLKALRRFTKDKRSHRQCALPRVKDVCADMSVLWRGEEHVQTVRNDLARVTQILDAATQGLSTIGTGSNTTEPVVIEGSIAIDARKLEESTRKLFRCSWFARQARKVADAVLETARG